MPDAMREVWTGSRGELADIEFRYAPAPTRDALVEASERWLAGQSAAIERLRTRATTIAREGSAVIAIHGEPGSGKLRTAQWIHRCSARASRPVLVLDAGDESALDQLDRVIAALAPNPGASAPGTVVLRQFERADELVVDRLLEILGGQGVELVCSMVLLSKRSPEQLRELSSSHAALLARAGSSVVAVPALRQRGGDVGELARIFAEEAARRYDKPLRGISAQALSKLEAHEFPGNVRELQALVEQAVLRSSGDWVTGDSFLGLDEDDSIRATNDSELVIRLPGSSLREIEIEALRLALRLSEGRIVRASELLGITRHALRRKLEKFGLNDLRAEAT